LHGSRADNARLLDALIEANDAAPCDVVVCAPFVYLWECGRALKDSRIALGAQDVCAEAQGAFTGEVFGGNAQGRWLCARVVGHSERRAPLSRGRCARARKFVAAQAAGLAPILCVGETLEEREGGVTRAVVARQLDAVLGLAGVAAFARAIVAYEPVWAIGTGKNASPAQAQEVHAFIRERFLTRDATIGGALRLLYGAASRRRTPPNYSASPMLTVGWSAVPLCRRMNSLRICAAAA